MALTTIEVEVRNGQITAKGDGVLPHHVTALLTFNKERQKPRDPLEPDPALRVVFHEDPTAPLDPEDWPEAFR